MADSFFTTRDNHWFQPTSHTRGPWDANHCHAGPPTGMIARALEQLLPGQRLTRLTVNLIRPVPFSGFQITTEVTRTGRIVSISTAALLDHDGKQCVTATALHMTPQSNTPFPTLHNDPVYKPEDAVPGKFPIEKSLHNMPSFKDDGVSVMYPEGQTNKPGPTISWLRTVPLLPDETPSAFQRICPLADCGNAFSRNAEPWEVNFMNPDLTLLLHRDPVGEWLGTDAQSHWQPDGIGMSDARLFDQRGSVGRAIQTLLLRTSDVTC
ncbi:hypothetical protein AB833_12475 [Chromatiales bacterium (ex Bugula neritina AB1)]|nr:hypothetical protein AB833_12475 [Chromatiales bacterium (ex Bugula neritina AB1)]